MLDHPARVVAAFALSIRQLGDRAILSVLARSLAVTLAIFAALGGLVYLALDRLLHPGTGLAAAAAAVATALAFWLLFRAIGIAVVGMFADDVVVAVEAKHYPAALATARPVGLARGAAMGLRSAARVVLVNIALLPVYLVLLATGVGTAAVFFVVNGWLLGRDLGDMVAARHLDRAGLRAWRRSTVARRFALGLADTALFVVPVANILAPVLGAAMATHMFHRGRR